MQINLRGSYRLNQSILAVSFEPGRSLRRGNLFDPCFLGAARYVQSPQPASESNGPPNVDIKKYAVFLYYNTQASVPTINLV